MPLNGSGLAAPPSAIFPITNGTLGDADQVSNIFSDAYTCISSAVMKDGQTTPTANLPMNGFKFTGVGQGTSRTDGATVANLQDGTGIYVATVGGTVDAITLAPTPGIAAYVAGQTFRFFAAGANTGAVTIAVSGLTAKDLTKNGTTALSADDIASGSVVEVTYDGTRFLLGTSGLRTIPSGVSLETPLDTVFRILGSGDATKKIADEVDGLTTATTRTRYHVDEDVSVGQSWDITNLTLVATVNSNTLTLAVKTKNGTEPSTTDPIFFKFRSATIGNGDYVTVALTAALSLDLTGTLGTVSAVAHRLYLGIANDAGTLRLFAYNTLDSSLNLLGLHDDLLQSSTAEGGNDTANSAHVLYSATAFSSKAIRVLGYVESTQATAGTWAITPSKIHLLKPWDKRTGDLMQVARSATGAVSTGTTAIPDDDTIPQNSEGDEYLSKAITPSSAINLLRIQSQSFIASSVSQTCHAALFSGSAVDALAAIRNTVDTAGFGRIFSLTHLMQAGTSSALTLRIRIGTSGSGTLTFNGTGGARRYGGVAASFIEIQELMV